MLKKLAIQRTGVAYQQFQDVAILCLDSLSIE